MTSGYQLRVVSSSDVEPVSVAEARRNSNVEDDVANAYDQDFAAWISAARELAEAYTKRSFVERTYLLTLSTFPTGWNSSWNIPIPNGPCIDVIAVSYLDIAGVRTTLDPSTYQLIEDEPPFIALALDQWWPSVRNVVGSVAVEYRAGYSSAGSPIDAMNVPALAKQAIKMLVSHWYEQREATGVSSLEAVPFGFYTSLDPLRTYP